MLRFGCLDKQFISAGVAELVPRTQRGAGDATIFMFYVYVLKSKENGRLYVGQTHNLRQRFHQHREGNVWTTHKMGRLDLIFYEAFKAKSDAIRRERYLKTSKGKSSLRQIIRDSLIV